MSAEGNLFTLHGLITLISVTKAGGFSKLKVKLQRLAAEAAAEAAAEQTSMEV